jgi:hypothetical protein
MFNIVFSLFYLLEYIILFILSNSSIYILFLYKYSIRDNVFFFKKKNIYINNSYIMKKKKKKIYRDKIFRLYYNK